MNIRQSSILNDLIEKTENCVLVCHEGYIRLLMCNVLGLPVYKRHLFKCSFGSITELNYNYDRKEWKIIKINQEIVVGTYSKNTCLL